jgi:hypothetical protein
MALESVRLAFEETPELFVAMQYLGMLGETGLEPLRTLDALENADALDRVMRVPIALAPPVAYFTPRQVAPHRRAEQTVYRSVGAALKARDKSPIDPTTGRTLFSLWMEGAIPFSPHIMGWSSDDDRASGYEDGRFNQ